MNCVRKQQGFTLLEVLIALAVGLFLISSTLVTFSSMRVTAEKINRYGEMHENGRLAINLLTFDLLHQGFWGSLIGDMDYSVMESLPNNLSGDCIGDGINNSTFPKQDGYFRTLWGETLKSPNVLNCINNGKVGSDMIQIKRVQTSAVSLTSLKRDRFYLVTNTYKGAIFDADDVPHHIENSSFWEYQHHIYYVREDSLGGEKTPVLIRGRLDSHNKPFHFSTVLDGIEFLHFSYGVDTNNDGVVNIYLSANNMLEEYWDHQFGSNILTITMFVLVRELKPDNQYENLNTYTLGDLTLSFIDKNGKGDNYHRLLLTSTVVLQN